MPIRRSNTVDVLIKLIPSRHSSKLSCKASHSDFPLQLHKTLVHPRLYLNCNDFLTNVLVLEHEIQTPSFYRLEQNFPLKATAYSGLAVISSQIYVNFLACDSRLESLLEAAIRPCMLIMKPHTSWHPIGARILKSSNPPKSLVAYASKHLQNYPYKEEERQA